MKKVIAVSNILSWFNLIVSGALVLFALASLLFIYPGIQFLISAVLVGCITLHSYAALQLRKSILNAAMPLNKQTPVGIRMMGYMSLFFAIILFSQSVFMLQNIQEIIKQAQFPPQAKKIDMKGLVTAIGIFMVIFSISVIVNVGLNLRLLKLYTITRNSEMK
jgi:hypothetical protein